MGVTTRSVAFETVPDRCPHCSKKMAVDIGADYFGRPAAPVTCLDCGTPPEQADWATGLRAAIAAVTSRRATP